MESSDPEQIKNKSEALATASHKLAEVMYQQAQQGADEAGGEPQPDKADDDVVDAEFEEVDDKKK